VPGQSVSAKSTRYVWMTRSCPLPPGNSFRASRWYWLRSMSSSDLRKGGPSGSDVQSLGFLREFFGIGLMHSKEWIHYETAIRLQCSTSGAIIACDWDSNWLNHLDQWSAVQGEQSPIWLIVTGVHEVHTFGMMECVHRRPEYPLPKNTPRCTFRLILS